MKENERKFLEKIKLYAIQVIEFKSDMNFIEFSNDIKTISACVFNLSQIGELVTKLDNEFMEKHNQIPWRKIKGLRNRIVHDYEGIQLNMVWSVIVDFLPELIEEISAIL